MHDIGAAWLLNQSDPRNVFRCTADARRGRTRSRRGDDWAPRVGESRKILAWSWTLKTFSQSAKPIKQIFASSWWWRTRGGGNRRVDELVAGDCDNDCGPRGNGGQPRIFNHQKPHASRFLSTVFGLSSRRPQAQGRSLRVSTQLRGPPSQNRMYCKFGHLNMTEVGQARLQSRIMISPPAKIAPIYQIYSVKRGASGANWGIPSCAR